MVNYDKVEIREYLTMEDIFDLLLEWGGEPMYQGDNIIISRTICHNNINSDASHKLYYYEANHMFHCYSGCPDATFDIFELVRKVNFIQKGELMDLNEAVRWIAYRFGFSGSAIEQGHGLSDKEIFDKYSSIEKEYELQEINLKNYDPSILKFFNYSVEITPWVKEGISSEILKEAKIGFYPGGDQITIPHFDKNRNLIGIRGRTLVDEDAQRYGKYRPLKIEKELYNHPLGLNLYMLPNTLENIRKAGIAIVVESEKSVLKYATYFGIENNICVAVCGSNLSIHQMRILLEAGAKEIVICFDKQWKKPHDQEFNVWTKKLEKINQRFHNEVLISFMFDKWNLVPYKECPLDCSREVFLKLFEKRIII